MTLYHGTIGYLQNGIFEFKKSHRSTLSRPIYPRAIFFTQNYELAKKFTIRSGQVEEFPVIVTADIDVDSINILDLREYDERNRQIIHDLGIDTRQFQYQDTLNLWEIAEKKEMVTDLLNQGYKGMLLNEAIAASILSFERATSWAIFDLSKIQIVNQEKIEL